MRQCTAKETVSEWTQLNVISKAEQSFPLKSHTLQHYATTDVKNWLSPFMVVREVNCNNMSYLWQSLNTDMNHADLEYSIGIRCDLEIQHKVVPTHAVKTRTWSGGTASLILNLDIIQILNGRLNAPAALSLAKENTVFDKKRGWVGPRAGLDVLGNRKPSFLCRVSKADPSVIQPVV